MNGYARKREQPLLLERIKKCIRRGNTTPDGIGRVLGLSKDVMRSYLANHPELFRLVERNQWALVEDIKETSHESSI